MSRRRTVFDGPTMAERVARLPDAPMRIAPTLSAGHALDCGFRIAETSAAAIECEHGYDVCPICDPCTCRASSEDKNDG